METRIILAAIIIFLYIIIVIIKQRRIPSSISETYYSGGGIWFTIILLIASFLVTPNLLDLSEGSMFQFLSFLTGGSLAFVGVSGMFREKLTGLVHYTSAFFLCIGSQLWIIIFGNPWSLLLWLSLPFWIKYRTRTFWSEIVCLITIVTSVL